MTDERARLYGRALAIFSAPEAVGVERLAAHFAFVATKVSIAEARGIMNAARPDRPPLFDEEPLTPVLPAFQ
ncbi:hypothetical protein [Bosea massiliensis]|uniref:Uncharacterized protein n=1 Tax=Bosea massiliensis TaxID=151419 RepID=A0ABW0NWN7_9HYPH